MEQTQAEWGRQTHPLPPCVSSAPATCQDCPIDFLAKQVVARGWARRALVQLAYAIGVAEPVSFLVETYGTESDPRRDFAAELSREFDLRPQGIIRALNLLRPIYYPTAAYGHFGRTDVALPWEETVSEGVQVHV